MAIQYRKFKLSPGQQAPNGSTGITISDGQIVWIGEAGTFPGSILSSVMTQEEIDFYMWIIGFPDRIAAAKAIFENSIVWDISYADVDTYIDNNVTTLPEAKEFLKKLSKIVLANLKFNGLVK